MPGQFHRRGYLYAEVQKDQFGHVGKEYAGLVCGRWPLLALFRDRTYYHNVGTFGVCLGPWLELGIFIDFRSEDQARGDRAADRIARDAHQPGEPHAQ